MMPRVKVDGTIHVQTTPSKLDERCITYIIANIDRVYECCNSPDAFSMLPSLYLNQLLKAYLEHNQDIGLYKMKAFLGLEIMEFQYPCQPFGNNVSGISFTQLL